MSVVQLNVVRQAADVAGVPYQTWMKQVLSKEAIATVLSLRDQIIPPTINLDEPDPACDLDYVPHVARPGRIDVALSKSMGFGGHNASLILKRYTAFE
jgi:hypothetical protein